MFGWFESREKQSVAKAYDKLLEKMEAEQDLEKLLELLKQKCDLDRLTHKDFLSKETLFKGFISLAGLWLVLNFEKVDTIRSKAFSMLERVKL